MMVKSCLNNDSKIKKYEYMVVYSFKGGVGRIEITSEKPIQSYDDVVELDKVVSKSNGLPNVFVTDFKLLREYWGNVNEGEF